MSQKRRGMLFTEKLLEPEGRKWKYIGEIKDGVQKQDKKNKPQKTYWSEDGGGCRNIEVKEEGKTCARTRLES